MVALAYGNKLSSLKLIKVPLYKSKFQEETTFPSREKMIHEITRVFRDIADYEMNKLLDGFPIYLKTNVEELAEKGKLVITPSAADLDKIAEAIGTRDLIAHINYVIANKLANWGISFVKKEYVPMHEYVLLNKFEEGAMANINLYNPVTMQVYIDGTPHMLVDLLGELALSPREKDIISDSLRDRINFNYFWNWYEDYLRHPHNPQAATHLVLRTGGNYYAYIKPSTLMGTTPEKSKIGKVRELKKLAQESTLMNMTPYKPKFTEAKKPAAKAKFSDRKKLVKDVIDFFNNIAESTCESVRDEVEEYEYLIYEEAAGGKISLGNNDNESLSLLLDKFGTREEVSKEVARQLNEKAITLHSGFLPMGNYNVPEFPANALVFNYIDETEHENQLDLDYLKITSRLKALTEEERDEVERKLDDVYLRDTWEDIDKGSDSIWVYINCNGAICYWVMIDDVLGGGKAATKMQKTRDLKKLAQETNITMKPYKRLFSEITITGIKTLSELNTAMKDHIANSDSFDYKDYVQDVQLRGKYLVILVKAAQEEKGARKLEKHLKKEFKDIGKVFTSEVETAYGQTVIRYAYKDEKK